MTGVGPSVISAKSGMRDVYSTELNRLACRVSALPDAGWSPNMKQTPNISALGSETISKMWLGLRLIISCIYVPVGPRISHGGGESPSCSGTGRPECPNS